MWSSGATTNEGRGCSTGAATAATEASNSIAAAASKVAQWVCLVAMIPTVNSKWQILSQLNRRRTITGDDEDALTRLHPGQPAASESRKKT